KLREIDARLSRANQQATFAKATYDVDRYAFEVDRDRKVGNIEERQKAVEEEGKRVVDLNLEVDKINAERAAVNAELGKYTGESTKIQKDIDAILFDQNRLEKQLDAIQPSLVKNVLNGPLIDFMAPTLTVRQTVLPTVLDDVNFTKVPKMDRCTTCHLAIDSKGYEKYPQPYTTHPNLSVYLGSDSPHPLNKIGCTVCHQGM